MVIPRAHRQTRRVRRQHLMGHASITPEEDQPIEHGLDLDASSLGGAARGVGIQHELSSMLGLPLLVQIVDTRHEPAVIIRIVNMRHVPRRLPLVAREHRP